MRPLLVTRARPRLGLRRWPGSPAAVVAAVAALSIGSAARAQSCSFNPNQPGTVSFGTIDPTQNTPRTFAITVNYKCTGGANATFAITGGNDAGPGVYRLQNTTQSMQFMSYSITTADNPGTKITLTGLLVAADYRDAWPGTYSDSLRIDVFP